MEDGEWEATEVELRSDLPQLLLQFPAQALRFIPVLEPQDRIIGEPHHDHVPTPRFRQATT